MGLRARLAGVLIGVGAWGLIGSELLPKLPLEAIFGVGVAAGWIGAALGAVIARD